MLENDRQGLNLTWEVRDGIAHHSKGKGGSPVGMPPSQRSKTLEGQIVRVADLAAYVNHDIDDAQRAGILKAGGPAGLGRGAAGRLVLRAESARWCATWSRPPSAATCRKSA